MSNIIPCGRCGASGRLRVRLGDYSAVAPVAWSRCCLCGGSGFLQGKPDRCDLCRYGRPYFPLGAAPFPKITIQPPAHAAPCSCGFEKRALCAEAETRRLGTFLIEKKLTALACPAPEGKIGSVVDIAFRVINRLRATESGLRRLVEAQKEALDVDYDVIDVLRGARETRWVDRLDIKLYKKWLLRYEAIKEAEEAMS